MSITLKVPSIVTDPLAIYIGGFIATVFYVTYKSACIEIDSQKKYYSFRVLNLPPIMKASVEGLFSGLVYGIAWPVFVPVMIKYWKSRGV